MNINNVAITGNLVAAPELRYTLKDTPVVSGTLGNNETYVDEAGNKQQVTTFVDFHIWNKRGEAFAKLVTKGQHLYLEGQLRQETWKDKEDGKTRSKHVIRVSEWQFTQFRKAEDQESATADAEAKAGAKSKRSRKGSAATPPPLPTEAEPAPAHSDEGPF
jgi:single-strand DNA-binding protein